jgi:hypothetical protein
MCAQCVLNDKHEEKSSCGQMLGKNCAVLSKGLLKQDFLERIRYTG